MGVERMGDFFADGAPTVDAIVGETAVRAYLDAPFRAALGVAGSDPRITIAREDLPSLPPQGTHVTLEHRLYAAKWVAPAGNDLVTIALEQRSFAVRTLANRIHQASTGGTPVDLLGFAAALVIFDLGDWYDGVHAPNLEHSADGLAWSVVDPSDIVGTLPVLQSTSNQNTVSSVVYRGGLRYLRGVTDITGAIDGAFYGVIVVELPGLSVA